MAPDASAPLAEAAWLLPLATIPLALTLTCASTGLTPSEIWGDGGVWLGAIGAAGLLSSFYAARILASAATPSGPPPALAILPFVFPHVVGLFGTRAYLARIFVARTYCGPGSREQVITSSLVETLLTRLAPLFISCAGVMMVAIATVFVSRRLEARVRWATIGATSALCWSLAVTALSVSFLRVKLDGMLDVSVDSEGSWLRLIVEHYRDYSSAANTLLVASLVFAAAALNRSLRASLMGVVTLGAVFVTATGIRASVLLDETQLRAHFEEFPMFEAVRPLDPNETTWGIDLEDWRSGGATVRLDLERASKRGGDDFDPRRAEEFAKARANGTRWPWPVALSVRHTVPTLEFRDALLAMREGGVSDVIFNSPIPPFAGAPRALRPLVEFQNSFDWSDAISVRFADEAACQATNLRDRPMVRTPRGLESAWRLPCETAPLEDVTAENVHALATAALGRGNRLVVLVPRLKETSRTPSR